MTTLQRVRINIQHAILRPLAAAGRRRTNKPGHLQVGERGEFEALFFLRRQRFIVVERRWRTRHFNGDLDLIAWEQTPFGPVLCFIEVKTRSQRTMTPAALAVDATKRRMLRRLSAAYIRTLAPARREGLVQRFDVLSIYLGTANQPEFELVRNISTRWETDPGGFGV